MSGSGGFSLVEMLVVVAIVSVLSVGATLPLARSGPSVAGDASALEAEAARLRRLAILSDATHALALSATGWRAERRNAGGWARLGEAVPFGAARAALEEGEATRLILLPDGRTSEMAVRLEGAGSATICRTGGAAPLTCGAP